ncbi:MAG: hypothetical protein KAH48_04750, partial [Chlorobi bacterium]|nr:hypothetical protein [Chlorobiota bacterium]
MKRKITLLLIVFMALISFESYAQDISTIPDGKYVFNQDEITPAQVKALKAVNKDVICIFENFEWNDVCTYGYNNTIGNWTDTNRVGEYYYPWIKADPRYGKYTVKLIYSDATLAAYDMTDFDVVIFPMGHYPINVQTTGGTKVITVINELLAANKCVIIWGDGLLYHAFDGNSSNKDPLAAEFFTEKLQIEYQGRKNLIEGSYFKAFAMFGPANEYISKGLVQFCNINANPHGNQGTAPPRSMRASVETFGLMDGSPSEPHDYYTEFIDMTNINKYNDDIVKTDNLLGCHRKMEGAGKIVYWSIGFEILNYAYWHNILEIQDLLWRSIRWCYQDMLLPEPFLEFSHEPLEFDEVPVGGAKELDFEITNVGGDVLEISELHYDDFNFEEASENYEIILGGVTADDPPLKLAPLEKHKCRVRFTPTEQSMYEGGIEVWSDATNGELLGMSMTGHGGKKIEQGPHMVVADTVYFGQIKLGKGVEYPVKFENIGT